MRYTRLPYHAIIAAAGLQLAACASETDVGGIGTPPAEGVLKDANVSGLSYRSGGEEGETTAGGGFTYEVGRDVTFHLGDLIIGTATGQAVVTPIDFVQNGSSSSVEVLNRVRLLMLLDEDADPTNGIQITTALRDRAETEPTIWQPVDFSVSEQDFNGELDLIFFDLTNTLGRPQRSLVTLLAAENHLESTLRCVRAGGYRGTLAGGDSGNFGAMVDAATGLVQGYAVRNDSQTMIELDGDQAVSLDQDAFFSSSDPATDATFTGSLSNADEIFGQWNISSLSQASGTFLGERIGGEIDAVYRFTATYEGNADAGIYTFDINAANNVTGFAYSVRNNSLTTLVGTLSNNVTLFANTTDPKNITADVDLATGSISGGDSLGNTLTGSGCRLN
jgi:hypothetical protein